MEPQKAREHIPPPATYSYATKDAILYAIGIGANTAQDLHFVYEGHTDFQVFPTFAVVPGFLASTISDWPGIQFDLTRILHGEHYIELFAPFPPDGTQLRSETRVADVLDKGKSALIIIEVTTFDQRNGEKLAFQQFGVFQGGTGGFGGSRSSPAERKAPPIPEDRSPDFVFETKTHPDQAASYRLGGGDLNPLHIDPNFARMAGFQKPILHGLCTLAIASRMILRAFGQNQGKNMRSIKVRFSAPVEPGQTLVVETWKFKEGDTKVLFQAKVRETGKLVLSNGCIELKEMVVNENIPQQQTKVKEAQRLRSAELFKAIEAELKTNRKTLKAIKDAVILYEITSGGEVAGIYTVELKSGEGKVYEGEPPTGVGKATVTVRVDDEDFAKLVSGHLDGTRAFLGGRLKVRGNVALLQKMEALMRKERSKL